MKWHAVLKQATPAFILGMLLFSGNANAAIDNAGIFDNVLSRYSTAASTWTSTITARATWLFWTLAVISMVWTFGMMALRQADIGEFFSEFVRFTIFTGFFWWLLTNGPTFATSIMDSLRAIGGNATGTAPRLTPSGIVDIGFDIFSKVIDQSTALSPVNSAVGIIISAAVLVVLALIGVNMLLLLVSGWILAYAGVFFLGFGGSRWTSDMAINYFKTVLSLGAQLFTMVLLVGIGKSFIDQYYANMSVGVTLKELGVMLIVSVVLLALVNKVPPLIGNLAMGGGIGSLGTGFGTGAAVGAAAMGAMAASSAGTSVVAGLSSVAGGAQALMSAYSNASASEDARDRPVDMISAGQNTQGSNHGGNSLATAMGDVADSNAFNVTSSTAHGNPRGGSTISLRSAAPGENERDLQPGANAHDGVHGSRKEALPNASGKTTQPLEKSSSRDETESSGRNEAAGSDSDTENARADATGRRDTLQAGGGSGHAFANSNGGLNSPTRVSLEDVAGEGVEMRLASPDDQSFQTQADASKVDSGSRSNENTKNRNGSLQRATGPESPSATEPHAGHAPSGRSAENANPGQSTVRPDNEQRGPAQSSALAATAAAAAKASRIAAGTAVNLAQGSWDVAKAKGNELKDSAMNRIGETTGGKIAAAIKARENNAAPTARPPSTDDRGASRASDESVDAEAEVAAFRDRDPKTS